MYRIMWLHAPVAQLVEQLTCNQQVVSSNLTGSSKIKRTWHFAKFFCYNEMMVYSEFVQLLKNNTDKKYADFSQKLTNSDYVVIGVRVPILRKLVKAHYHDETLPLNDFELGKYLEVDFSYFAIGLLRCKTAAEQLTFLRKNLCYAKSWMITDMITSFLRSVSFEDFWSYFLDTHTDEHVYTRRFAYVFALKFYREQRILNVLPYIKSNEDYMVSMGQAWLLATIAICYPKVVYDFLSNSADINLKKKTISKIKDSYRIDDITKNKFVGLRCSCD